MMVVEMTESHLSEIAALEQLCFSEPWGEASLREELGQGLFLVAVEGGAVAGYVGCQTVLDEGYITNVAVFPEYRRQGIAERLLTTLFERAAGLTFITLEVRASNTPALALYEKLGFVRVGERRGYYRSPKEDAVLLTRWLK